MKITKYAHKAWAFICSPCAWDLIALSTCHERVTGIAPIKFTSFWLGTQKFIIDSNFVQVTNKLVTLKFSFFYLFQFIVGDTFRNMIQNLLVDIIQAYSTGVDYVRKIGDEKAVPDSLVDPGDLQEEAGNEFVETVGGAHLRELEL